MLVNFLPPQHSTVENDLTGSVPAEMASMTSLVNCDLSKFLPMLVCSQSKIKSSHFVYVSKLKLAIHLQILTRYQLHVLFESHHSIIDVSKAHNRWAKDWM